MMTSLLQSTGQMMGSVRLYFLPEYTVDGRQPHHGEVRQATISREFPESILNCFIQYDAFSISEIGNEFLKRQLLVLVKEKYVKNSWQKLSVQVKEFRPRMNFVYTFVFGEIKKLIEKKRERERRGQAFLDWDA